METKYEARSEFSEVNGEKIIQDISGKHEE